MGFFFHALLIRAIFHSYFMQINSSSKDIMHPGVSSAIEQMVRVKLSHRAAKPQGISLVWGFIGGAQCPVICKYEGFPLQIKVTAPHFIG